MTKLPLITTAVFLVLSLGAANAADTSGQPDTGAAVGTPGGDNKGNNIAVPDNESRASGHGGNPVETTPGEENKGKPAIHE